MALESTSCTSLTTIWTVTVVPSCTEMRLEPVRVTAVALLYGDDCMVAVVGLKELARTSSLNMKVIR